MKHALAGGFIGCVLGLILIVLVASVYLMRIEGLAKAECQQFYKTQCVPLWVPKNG